MGMTDNTLLHERAGSATSSALHQHRLWAEQGANAHGRGGQDTWAARQDMYGANCGSTLSGKPCGSSMLRIKATSCMPPDTYTHTNCAE